MQVVARERVGANQGVYAEAEDGTILASLNSERPVHPASVSKVATTLVLLDRLGPAHRFTTTFTAARGLDGDTVEGDLVVESDGDPFFVFESAFLVLAELRSMGVRRVTGELRVHEPFLFNWEPDSGSRLTAAMSGSAGFSAWGAVQASRADLAGVSLRDAGLRFGGTAPSSPSRPRPSIAQRTAESRKLLTYRSPPLLKIMKALNSYSNNVFHPLSAAVGGPDAVERIVRERLAPGQRDEVVIRNCAGAGLQNRMSPRAAVGIVRALAREADEQSLALTDLLPVAGVDEGTLHERFADPETRGTVVAKTGSYGSLRVSALAGQVRTRRWGLVTFAVLDTGLSVPAARSRQDTFVRALIREGGGAIPLGYQRPAASPVLSSELSRER